MDYLFETERFLMRRLREDDAQGIFALDSDPEVHKYLGKNPITTLQQAEKLINDVLQQYIDNGIGRLAIIDKASNDFVGWTGIKLEKLVRDYDYYDIGYRLRKPYWRKGIGTETALASIQYGFEQLQLEEICGAADVENIASNKILQKIGLSYVEKFVLEGDAHNWYKIEKADWQKTI